MEFSGQYLLYDDYVDLGGTLAETPFNLLEFEARKLIDTRTFNRLKNINNSAIPQEVKICEFNLINSLNGYVDVSGESTTNRNVTSENTDGYSINYISPAQISEIVVAKNDELNDIITTYLFGIIINNEHIIYAGV